MVEVASISQQIWDMKYRLKGVDGRPVDKTISDTWRRVARALAQPESDAAGWEERFFSTLEEFRFLPAGRIVSGAGAARNVTLFNCFVMGDIPDDMSGIFDGLKEAALTMQQGGGIGYDFSTLRPKGAAVRGVGADASGPLSFMDVWDAMCRTIMSAGARRGAMMAAMRCDHPDIEAFVEAKKEPGRLRMFNLSVLVTDAFMRAVKEDGPWALTFDGVGLQEPAGAGSLGQDHAGDLRLRRARGDLHRRHQPPRQPLLLRAHPRHESVWRTAAAPLRCLSPGLREPDPAGHGSLHRSRPAGHGGAGRRGDHRGAHVGQCHRRLPLPAPQPRARGAGQAPHGPRRHRTRRRPDHVSGALRRPRGGGLDRRLDEGDPARRLLGIDDARRREGRLPPLRRREVSFRRDRPRPR